MEQKGIGQVDFYTRGVQMIVLLIVMGCMLYKVHAVEHQSLAFRKRKRISREITMTGSKKLGMISPRIHSEGSPCGMNLKKRKAEEDLDKVETMTTLSCSAKATVRREFFITRLSPLSGRFW